MLEWLMSPFDSLPSLLFYYWGLYAQSATDYNKQSLQFMCYGGVAANWHINGLISHVPSVFERKEAVWSSTGSLSAQPRKALWMLGNIQAMLLVGWRLCKLYESGKMTPGQASLGKAWTSKKAREVVSLARELLGGNGILADFLVAKAFCDLEPIFSYEGTYDINSLVIGRDHRDCELQTCCVSKISALIFFLHMQLQ